MQLFVITCLKNSYLKLVKLFFIKSCIPCKKDTRIMRTSYHLTWHQYTLIIIHQGRYNIFKGVMQIPHSRQECLTWNNMPLILRNKPNVISHYLVVSFASRDVILPHKQFAELYSKIFTRLNFKNCETDFGVLKRFVYGLEYFRTRH